jgi:glycolate oxidase FAD binding subunit
LDLSALTGIVDYEPGELVLTTAAATPLPAIEALLAASSQRLPFEPPNFARLLASEAVPTIGGTLATNLSGSRRLTAGAARDHFLGLTAVSGRGEIFKGGARVVKNVTGYDLPKLLAGSWGTLAVMTEVTLKVAPAPEAEQTMIWTDTEPAAAAARMQAALCSDCEVSAAAFDAGRGTALRLEGPAASVVARGRDLLRLLGAEPAELLAATESQAYWQATGAAELLAAWPVVWRISIPPADCRRVLESLQPERYLLDWGGGLLWAAFDRVEPARVRGAVREGHAMLFKAPPAARRRTSVMQPTPPALAAVLERVRHAFDPERKLNPGRIDAN